MSAEKQRLTFEMVRRQDRLDAYWIGCVYLDGERVFASRWIPRESEARAAAEAYVSELLAHFRRGGS